MINAEAIVQAQRAWRTAVAVGDDEAQVAAAAALGGLGDAVRVLLENLAALGYPDVPGLIPPSKHIDVRLRKLGAKVGAVPPILAAFWRSVGGVSLVDLEDYEHVDFWDAIGVAGPDGFCDGAHVHACRSEWVKFTVQDFIDQAEDPDVPPDGSYLLSLAPDGYHKDNISGGAAYGLDAGAGWLAPWRNFAWTGARRPDSAPPDPCDFLGYLRTSILECAGFPGLFGVGSFEPIRRRLLRHVEVF